MSLAVGMWSIGGAMTGAAHAAMLWHAARKLTKHQLGMFLGRGMLLALGVTIATAFGGLVPASLGWAVGFGSLVLILVRMET